MNEALRRTLLAMEQEDCATRETLVKTGELFSKEYDYHPVMKVVHERNNQRMHPIIAEYGWPGFSLVGEDGCQAAGLVIQHAILDPELQKTCLPLLEAAVKKGEAFAWMYALLLDRTLVQRGKLQIYGSQHQVDDQGNCVPLPMVEPQNVDSRRAAVGWLPPLQQRTQEIQAERDQHGT